MNVALFAEVSWPLPVGILVILAAVVAIFRQLDVRFVLFIAALVLGGLAGQVDAIVRKFLATFADERFVIPICSAMGFSYVLRQTGCDQQLVRLLMKPLVRARTLLVPGAVLVGFLVNMPVVSQASTALAIGPVIIPILRAANIPALVIGSALLLGSSIGGELFNPGAPELRTTVVESNKAAAAFGQSETTYTTAHSIARLRPLNLLGLGVALPIFWWRSRRAAPPNVEGASESKTPVAAEMSVNYLQAMVPIIPLVFLAFFAPGIGLIELLGRFLPALDAVRIPLPWLEDTPGQFETRLIGVAMLVGSAAAVLTTPKEIPKVAESFFQGAGFGFTHIVSIIVAANCFGKGLELIGIARVLTDHLASDPRVLVVTAGVMSLGFAVLCGSGMATAQSLFPFFATSAVELGIDPTHVGAVVSLAAAAGRTMSPMAAVNQMCARLTDTEAIDLSRQVAPPLLAGIAAVILAAAIWIPQ